MPPHTHHRERFDALTASYTHVLLTGTNGVTHITFDRDDQLIQWPNNLGVDLAVSADDPADLPFGLTFYLVNDSSVAQTFEAGGVTYTVPAETVFEAKVMIVNNVKTFVSHQLQVPV